MASVGLAVMIAGCFAGARGGEGAASATTTGASIGGAPSKRTVDSSGFVDNAGSTSDERHQRAAARRGADRRERAAAAGSYESAIAGAPGYSIVSRLARARCDRELACGRIGAGLAHGSDDACIQNMRPAAYADVEEAGCEGGFSSGAVNGCLLSIRQVSCDTPLASIDVLEACQSASVCAGG